MSNIKTITIDNFAQDVSQKEGVTVLRFWAEWCGPCKRLEPVYQELADQLGQQAAFADVNIDMSPDVASALGIQSIPTVVLFKDGKPVDGIVGLAAKSQYASKIQALL